MLYIICTRDGVSPYASDDEVQCYSDDEWQAAQHELARLIRAFGPWFKLLDH